MNDPAMIADRLKKLVDANGLQYLEDHAYELYESMKEEKLLDDVYARVLLICLLSADYKNFERGKLEKTALSSSIQRSCALREDVSDQMADVFMRLFDEKNFTKWEEKQYSGLWKFCEEEWTFPWEGFSVWYGGHVHVNCRASASALVRIIDSSKVELDNEKLLKQNPFITAEKIFETYKNRLAEKIDSDFEYYCTCDDDYPPVTEDYWGNYEELVKEFCLKHGMELIDYEFTGASSNYL